MKIEHSKKFASFKRFSEELDNRVLLEIRKKPQNRSLDPKLTRISLRKRSCKLYSLREGESLFFFKNNRKINVYKSEFIQESISLLLHSISNNLVVNNILIDNINYEIGGVKTLNTRPDRSVEVDMSFSISSEEEAEDKSNTKKLTSGLNSKLNNFGRFTLYSKDRVNLVAKINKSKSLASKPVSFKPNLELKVLNLAQSEVRDYNLFSWKIKTSIQRYKDHVQGTQIPIDLSNLNNYEFLDTSLKSFVKTSSINQMDDLFKEKSFFSQNEPLNVSLETNTSVKSTRSIYSKNCNSKKLFVNEETFNLKKLQKAKRPSFFEKILQCFSCQSFFGDEEHFILSQKELDDELLKINKKNICPKTPKSRGLLTTLGLDPQFLEDFENVFYMGVDMLELYPSFSKKRNGKSLGSFKDLEYLKKPDQYALNLNTIPDDKIESFFTDAQIDIFISILAVIEKESFSRNQAIIMQSLGLFKKAELQRRKSISSFYKSQENQSEHLFKEDTDLSRFLRLKFLINDTSNFQKNKVFKLLGLSFSEVKHFLIKLGFGSSKSYKMLPPLMKNLFDLLKSQLFNFLIFAMMSNEYGFIYKFLIISALKAKN